MKKERIEDGGMDGESVLLARAKPVQKRARAKQESILNSARELILKVGPDRFTLQEIADYIGSPIGTIYRYYSGKPAILRAIAQSYLETLRSDLERELRQYREKNPDEIQFQRVIKKILELFEKAYSNDPVFQIVWSGSQAYPTLRELDLEDTRKNAEIIADSIECFVPKMKKQRLMDLCILVCDSIGSALRLTSMMEEKEKRGVLLQLRGMITNHLYMAYKSFGPD
ncbi:TetR family transcriptional regulator [Leptospira sp. 201903070]|uniref:TetR family transcriptional regulator n=1 Tax=Leptospira ainlahdjerensis TaxID=2810033 RepID=A0ABS2U9L3_9LEPT|nr:TetR/AcrR family transcriptional regulator [Leptospira ainlahdjerensis]MBM9577056.1 TetR family transcriptional regulator [Leptospira ainlahdjerensis]